MRYIGIDPGKSGGLAYLDDTDGCAAIAMPKTLKGILVALDRFTQDNTLQVHCVLEHVWTSPQMGVVSAGSFMFNYGALQMALVANDIPFELVAPLKWQNLLGCRTPKGRRAELGHKDKNITKRAAEAMLARDRLPNLKVTHAIADALLLASYARRTHRALLPPVSAEITHGKETRPKEKGQARRQAGAKQKGRAAAQASKTSPAPRDGHSKGPGA